MNKYKFFIYISLTCLLITSCGTVKEGFTNQKKESSDEFLVEKKSPLTMPPEFNQLPLPDMKNNDQDLEKNIIKSLITDNRDGNSSSEINGGLEDSILNEIKSN
tara:strand:- start:1021 stop:1332 length:312 start_codon:yes stop_codon:yes gene_type:complete